MLRLMDEVMRGAAPPGEAEAQTWIPNTEMHQTENELVISVELPGVKKEDLEVQVTGEAVTIRGQKSTPEETCSEGHICCTEFCYGPFERTLPWPVEVKPEESQSKLQDGILEIRVPLSETAQMLTPKQIEIQ